MSIPEDMFVKVWTGILSVVEMDIKFCFMMITDTHFRPWISIRTYIRKRGGILFPLFLSSWLSYSPIKIKRLGPV